MSKNKLERFDEMAGFSNVVQVPVVETNSDHSGLKGIWASEFFRNNNPIVLELGCGKGEYTLGLARKYHSKNFIGVDIKGARIWRGAKTALEENLKNAGFLRTRIEMIHTFFDKNEVDEIWITFPDPQPKQRWAKKRLTSSRFLNHYKEFLKPGGIVHLKTDSIGLYEYTCRLIAKNKLTVLVQTDDLYGTEKDNEILGIKTFYENQFLNQGKKITYLSFLIDSPVALIEPEPVDEKETQE